MLDVGIFSVIIVIIKMCQLLKCGGLLKQCPFVFGLDFNIKPIEASMFVINRKYHLSVSKVKFSQLYVNFWRLRCGFISILVRPVPSSFES